MNRFLSLFLAGILFVVLGSAQNLIGQKAPHFTLKTSDGKVVDLAKLKGKVVLVNFWATWCGPCRAEIPDFIEAYKANKGKGLEIVGIALDEDGWDKVLPFQSKNQMNYPVVLGSPELAQQYGGIEAIPTSFFIDKKGIIIDHVVGMLSKSALENKLKRFLK
jgi:thiol-disulfide isomerase/thioredoxin